MVKFFIGFVVLFSPFVWSDNEKSQIIEVMKKQEAAWNSGNLQAYMQGYWKSDELLFVGSSGLKKGWQVTLDNYIKQYPDKKAMGLLEFTIIKVEVNNNTAFVLGKWELERVDDNLSGYYTLFWRKINGNWRIIIDHSS